MAYLHCHCCDWSQDDFWSLKYNPLTTLWEDIKWLCKPRWFNLEGFIIEDIVNWTGIPTYIKQRRELKRPILKEISEWIGTPLYSEEKQWVTRNTPPKDGPYKRYFVHSWLWLLVEIIKNLKIAKSMKWWTFKSFKKDKGAVCPKCGKQCFDID